MHQVTEKKKFMQTVYMPEPRTISEQRKSMMYWLCPLVTFTLCLVFVILKQHGSYLVPQLSMLILGVLACATFAGLRIAVVVATASWLTLFYTYSVPNDWFKYDNIGWQRLVFGFFLLYGTALVVGQLRNKLLAAEVRLLEERYHDYAELFKDIDVPIVECDSQRILSVNGAFCRLTGFSEKELLNLQPPYPFWSQEDQAHTARVLESVMRGVAREFELTLVRKDGLRLPVLMYVSQIRTRKGHVARHVFSYHDLSMFKRTERELREEEKLLSDSITAADMALISVDVGAGVAHVRGRFEQLHGFMPGCFSGRLSDLQTHIPPEDWAHIMSVLQQAKRDRVNFEIFYKVNLPDGQVRRIRSAGCYQYDDAGTPLRALAILLDVGFIENGSKQIAANAS